MSKSIRVTVWNEGRHEKTHEAVRSVYPDGIHAVIAGYLNGQPGITARTATLDEPEHGLTAEVLADTDVLTWWGHMAHDDVRDEIVDRVQQRVLDGMGLIVLHSGHFSKIFRRMMGTSCALIWREAREHERLWVVNRGHPIVAGIDRYFELPEEEMYGELFDIPAPGELVFISWFPGGEVFRGGCCWTRGNGRIFYFQPGPETHPPYYDKNVMTVITNAVRWAAPLPNLEPIVCENAKALEPLG